jgi:hypothetical protein
MRTLASIDPALAISIFALMISFATFYYGFLRVSHDLYAITDLGYPLGTHYDDKSTSFQFKVIIVNKGNRSESILRLGIYSMGTSPGPVPFVIKPGDIQIFPYLDMTVDCNHFIGIPDSLVSTSELVNRTAPLISSPLPATEADLLSTARRITYWTTASILCAAHGAAVGRGRSRS